MTKMQIIEAERDRYKADADRLAEALRLALRDPDFLSLGDYMQACQKGRAALAAHEKGEG